MGFLNVTLLLGAAAFVVPLSIHLLNRSGFRAVDWAAMHLLDASSQRSSRLVEWRSLLLLLLRCLVPVLLAVCMARPLVRWVAVAGAAGRSTTVFLVDDSFSMQARASDGSRGTDGASGSGWEQVRRSATAVGEGLGGQAEIAVVAMGGPPRELVSRPVRDLRPVTGGLTRVAADAGPVRPAEAVSLAGELMADSSQPHRQVVLWSDFQRGDWTPQVEAGMATVRRQWDGLPVVPELHLIPVRVEPQPNVSVRFPATTAEVALIGEPVPLRVEVENHHDEPVGSLAIAVAIDGRELARRRIDLAAGAMEQIVFMVEFEDAGRHTADVTVKDSAGGISADDRDSLAVTVLPTRSVLLIEGEQTQPPAETSTGFLQLALESASDREDGGSAVRVRRVRAHELDASMVAGSDLIVMADVHRLTDEATVWLADRVANGGLLCVFGGLKIDREWYASRLGPGAPTPLLPMRYGDVAVDRRLAADPGVVDAFPTAGIERGPYADPRLAFFDDPRNGSLAAAVITRWHPLLPPVAAPTHPVAEGDDASGKEPPRSGLAADGDVLLRFDSGEPLAVSRSFGTGSVLQWAIAADDSSGNLPLQPAYVPLMQRLLLIDVSTATPRAVRERQGESLLDPLSPDEIAGLATRLGATVHASTADFLAHDADRRGGREIWRWLLAAVLAALFAETLLARRLTRGGRR